MKILGMPLGLGLCLAWMVGMAGCKPRNDSESQVLAKDGHKKLKGRVDSLDVSFFLPPVTAENIQKGQVVHVGAAARCGVEAPSQLPGCGPILSKSYFKQIALGHGPIAPNHVFKQGLPAEPGVPRFMEAKDMFTDFAGKQKNPNLSVPQRLEKAYGNLFISSIRFDPCAPTVHKFSDKKKFSKEDQCERELRFVVQHWENGKPADQGLHVGVRQTKEESERLLRDLVRLKLFAAKNNIFTNGVPIGPHPAMALGSPIRSQFFQMVKKICTDYGGDAVTKGIATFITLARPGGGVRWQWSLTGKVIDTPIGNGKGENQKFKFDGAVVIPGVANIRGNVRSPSGLFVAAGESNPGLAFMKRIKSVGFEVFKDPDHDDKRVTDVSPPSAVVPELALLTNTELFKIEGNTSLKPNKKNKLVDLDGNDLMVKGKRANLQALIEVSHFVENPIRSFLKFRPKDPSPKGVIGECSACHIQTPGRLRAYAELGLSDKKAEEMDRSFKVRYVAKKGITQKLHPVAKEEYIASNYLVLNFAWHDSFPNKRVHPSINMRAVNETAEVVRYINDEMMKN